MNDHVIDERSRSITNDHFGKFFIDVGSIDHQKTAFGLNSILTSFDLTTLSPTISRTERDTLKILSLLNSTHIITYNYTLRQHLPPSHIGEKKYMGRYWGGHSNPLNRPLEGDHESYDTKVFHLPKYTSKK